MAYLETELNGGGRGGGGRRCSRGRHQDPPSWVLTCTVGTSVLNPVQKGTIEEGVSQPSEEGSSIALAFTIASYLQNGNR